jgi:Zn-dependent peptidase ImmA (M78 family)
MESMALAHVTPKLLVWARTQAKLSQDVIAHKFVDLERIAAWEKGDQVPTFPQAEEFAKKCRVPLLTLFLTDPPANEIPLTDLRTVKDAGRKKLSANFRETINDAIVRQDWYREEFPNASPRILAKQFTLESNVVEVAEYLRRTLWINNDLLAECRDWKEYLERLAQNAEIAGVLVLRSGIVRNDGKRKLDIDEFRGFALINDVAPLIFVNANDTTTAQIFTLIHELVHICIGREGISNPDPTKAIEGMRNQTEAFCNKVAAEVLVPEKRFLRDWQSTNTNSVNLKRIVRFNKVSNMVALRRAFDLGKIEKDYFFRSVRNDYERFRKLKEKEEEHKQSGGPELFVLFPVRNSHKFTDSIFVALQGGKVAYTEAARLLGLTVPTLENFAKRRAA